MRLSDSIFKYCLFSLEFVPDFNEFCLLWEIVIFFNGICLFFKCVLFFNESCLLLSYVLIFTETCLLCKFVLIFIECCLLLDNSNSTWTNISFSSNLHINWSLNIILSSSLSDSKLSFCNFSIQVFLREYKLLFKLD